MGFAERIRGDHINWQKGLNDKYEIILYWSGEDDASIAEVPELPGCAAAGPTRQEALATVEIVINEWIVTARELGRSIPEPKGFRCEVLRQID